MTTIADTLDQIPELQDRIQNLLSCERPLDAQFLTATTNFTSFYYFSLLSHVCLDLPDVRSVLAPHKVPAVVKYQELSSNRLMLDELIRWQNIGGMFSIWVTFEQFIFRQHDKFFTKPVNDFYKAHDKILKKWGIKNEQRKEIHNIFTGIRRTRNTLHDDGVYNNEDGKNYEFTLGGKQYVLNHATPVEPLRVMTVLDAMVDHYEELADLVEKGGSFVPEGR